MEMGELTDRFGATVDGCGSKLTVTTVRNGWVVTHGSVAVNDPDLPKARYAAAFQEVDLLLDYLRQGLVGPNGAAAILDPAVVEIEKRAAPVHGELKADLGNWAQSEVVFPVRMSAEDGVYVWMHEVDGVLREDHLEKARERRDFRYMEMSDGSRLTRTFDRWPSHLSPVAIAFACTEDLMLETGRG
jgi:hypothetical protein